MYIFGQWCYLINEKEPGKIVEVGGVYAPIYTVYLPLSKKVICVADKDLAPITECQNINSEKFRFKYITAAAKISQFISPFGNREVKLLSPIESNVIPLPHQVSALEKVLSTDRVRYLIADEVGLGKTIEAGMVIKELKLRGKIRRILIVVPKGIATQWVSEMKNHFGEDFHLILGEDIDALDRIYMTEGGAWKQFNQVIVSIDSIKPINKRKGWSQTKIDDYNKKRLGNLTKANWDLIIIDEAHRLGGSTDQVSRYKLGKELSNNTPNLLLLTATPHQGKSDSFYRLMNILDPLAFPDNSSISKQNIEPFLVRTEKRKAIGNDRKPLFMPRLTEVINVQWSYSNNYHRELYDKVTEYASKGYRKSVEQKKPHIGFLMVLLQRLVTSSTEAILSTLERRLEILKSQKALDNMQGVNIEDWELLDGEEQEEKFITVADNILEEDELEELCKLAIVCKGSSEDAKAKELYSLIKRIEVEEGSLDDIKVLVFTEFLPTQRMLDSYLSERGFKVVCINGSKSIEERNEAQLEFENEAEILISTDAGGEGINLQFAHVIVNYDLPWNPMRIEQRIGRVDRIGQKYPVRAFNFILDNTVESRVREVLENKLQVVADELGVDKTSDVLDSNISGEAYQQALKKSILQNQSIDCSSETAINEIKREALKNGPASSLISSVSSDPSEIDIHNYTDSLLPFWIETMYVNYRLYKGDIAEKHKRGWCFISREGKTEKNVCFIQKQASTGIKSLSDKQVEFAYSSIPSLYEGERIPVLSDLGNLPSNLKGYWAMFKLSFFSTVPSNDLINIPKSTYIYIPFFLSLEGKVYKSSANGLWDYFLNTEVYFNDFVDVDESIKILHMMTDAFSCSQVDQYRDAYKAYIEDNLKRELQRMDAYGFYQEGKIATTSLDNVRSYRQNKLALFQSEIDNIMQSYRDFAMKDDIVLCCKVGNWNE